MIVKTNKMARVPPELVSKIISYQEKEKYRSFQAAIEDLIVKGLFEAEKNKALKRRIEALQNDNSILLQSGSLGGVHNPAEYQEGLKKQIKQEIKLGYLEEEKNKLALENEALNGKIDNLQSVVDGVNRMDKIANIAQSIPPEVLNGILGFIAKFVNKDKNEKTDENPEKDPVIASYIAFGESIEKRFTAEEQTKLVALIRLFSEDKTIFYSEFEKLVNEKKNEPEKV